MRLTQTEVILIKKAFKEVFNEGKIYLFGSRVDDNKKGGDIDLCIELSKKIPLEDLINKRNQFKLKLYDYIGEQKIDIVISKDKDSSFAREIEQTKVEL